MSSTFRFQLSSNQENLDEKVVSKISRKNYSSFKYTWPTDEKS